MVRAGGPPAGLWLVIALLAVGVYGLRLSFIQLRGVVEAFPPRLEQALGFLPAAILAALITPALVTLDGSIVTAVLNVRVLAGGLALLTARRTGSMIATIAVGMAVLWTATLLVG